MTAAFDYEALLDEGEPSEASPPAQSASVRRSTRPPLTLVLLRVVAFLLYGLGWTAARIVTGSWTAAVWSCIAVSEGWKAGTTRQRRPART